MLLNLKRISENNKHKVAVIMIVALFVILSFDIIKNAPLIWGDYSYITKDSRIRLSENLLYLWSDVNFGSSTRSALGNVIPIIFTSIPFINDQIIFLLNRILPLLLLMLISYHIAFTVSKRVVVAFIVSIFSIVNPVIYGDFLNGQTIWVYIPIFYALYFTKEVFFQERFDIKNLISFTLSIFFSIIFLPPIIFPFFFLLFFIILFSLFNQQLKFLKIVVSAFFILITISCLILPLFITSSSGKDSFISGSSLLGDYYHNYSETHISKTLRLAGNNGNGQKTLLYNINHPRNLIGYYLIGIIIFALIISNFSRVKTSNPKDKLFFFSVVSTALLIIGFLHILATNRDIGSQLFQYGWIAGTIRNPTKIYLLLLVVSAFSLLFSIDIISKILSKKHFFFFSILVFISIFSYGWPVFGLDFGLSKNRPLEHYKKNVSIEEIAKKVERKREERSILIPSNHEDALNYQNTVTSLNTFRLGGSLQGSTLFQSNIIQSLNERDPSFFLLMNLASIDSIFLKKEYEYNLKKKFSLFAPIISHGDAYQFLSARYPAKKLDNSEVVQFSNTLAKPKIRAASILLNFNSEKNLASKILFSESFTEKNFEFYVENGKEVQRVIKENSINIQSLYEDINTRNISENGISKSLNKNANTTSLYTLTLNDSILIDGNDITILHGEKSENFLRTSIQSNSETLDIHYKNAVHNFSNHIPNPSFEDGLWKEKVGDCNNFDKNGLLDMKRSDEASDGSHSLELHATRHIACTNQKFPVTAGRTYLFSFDYQSPNAKQAGFHIGFDNPDKTSASEKIPFPKKPERGTRNMELGTDEWLSFTKQITVPDGATNASLHVYSYSTDNETDIVTRYDNFSFIELPDIADRYYLVSDPETNFVEPREITFDLINPTKKLVHIKGATTPFYLAMSESYHPEWQAQLSNKKIGARSSERGTWYSELGTWFSSWIPWVKPDRISDDKHFELNGFLNGWFVEPEALCANGNTACIRNPDGSYDMEMTLEFFPQRWFYLGLLISGTTLLACLGYLGYDFFRRRKNKQLTTN